MRLLTEAGLFRLLMGQVRQLTNKQSEFSSLNHKSSANKSQSRRTITGMSFNQVEMYAVCIACQSRVIWLLTYFLLMAQEPARTSKSQRHPAPAKAPVLAERRRRTLPVGHNTECKSDLSLLKLIGS